MMNRSQHLSSSSSHLLCIEGTMDQPQRKQIIFWGDPADVGVEKISHASHPHPLYQFKLEIQDETNCSICSSPIDGFAHGCEACNFFIHDDDDCLSLEVEIHHKSHPAHPLRLHPPSYDRNICDACRSPANTPFYRCSICDYDLHVDCAALPESQRDLDGNLIRLHHSFPLGASVWCSECNAAISRRGWVWYIKDTGYTAHLECGPKLSKLKPIFLRHAMRYLQRRRRFRGRR